ncbi:MAG: 1-deoxy-D-xylulose-5-phosphate reductoisomerase [Proteobacteria bacterium]|nr:1-deoxy-D-xylulose-5-phosphate reductoisomerase [Pseudomonadota bacterium]
MKNIIILGSTGSIGRSTLEVVKQVQERYKVTGLAAGSNLSLLREQVRKFKPDVVSVKEGLAAKFRQMLPRSIKVEVVSGTEGLEKVATLPQGEMVVSALVGGVGLLPTLAAIRAGKNIALANKECLVMAGEMIMAEAEKGGIKVLPIDSEHSAIFQCLVGHRKDDLRRIILTASGGPFLTYSQKKMTAVTPEMALAHPNWQMGKKVSIDSATLMNKGLEVIEAHYLFGVPVKQIEVYIHPQSSIHAFVEYIDGSLIAQLSYPDMKVPIAYALSYPERLPVSAPRLNLLEIEKLTFLAPDRQRFPALDLAYRAIQEGGGLPIVLSAANEVAVEAFLERRLSFTQIAEIIERVMSSYNRKEPQTLDVILEIDRWGREKAEGLIKNL